MSCRNIITSSHVGYSRPASASGTTHTVSAQRSNTPYVRLYSMNHYQEKHRHPLQQQQRWQPPPTRLFHFRKFCSSAKQKQETALNQQKKKDTEVRTCSVCGEVRERNCVCVCHAHTHTHTHTHTNKHIHTTATLHTQDTGT